MQNRNYQRLKTIIIILAVSFITLFVVLSCLRFCKKSKDEKMVVLEKAPEYLNSPYLRNAKQNSKYYINEKGDLVITDEKGNKYIVKADGSVWKQNEDGSYSLLEGEEKDKILAIARGQIENNEDLQGVVNVDDLDRKIDATNLTDSQISQLARQLGLDEELVRNLIDKANGEGKTLTLEDLKIASQNAKNEEEALRNLKLDALKSYLDSLGITDITPEELLKAIEGSGMTFEEFLEKAMKDGASEALKSIGIQSANLADKENPIFDTLLPNEEKAEEKTSYEKTIDALLNQEPTSLDFSSLREVDSYTALNGQSAKVEWLKSQQNGFSIVQKEKKVDNMLTNGTIINAVLLTGINTDLPGTIIAVVSQNVYDSFTKQNILIPKGSKLIASYDSSISWGQTRILVSWNQLILENGTIINLNGYQGTDGLGRAGLTGSVNNHLGSIIGGSLLSSLISIGTGYAGSIVEDKGWLSLINSLASSTGSSVQSVSENLLNKIVDRQPTICLDAGTKITILSNDNIILPIYKE